MPDPVPGADRSVGSLRIRRSGDDSEVVLSLGGELDLQSAPELERELAAIRSDRPRRMLLDLSQLEFMDSTGLAVIIGAEQAAAADGISVRLRAGGPQVQRLFELTGVLDQLTFDG
jgi:anti-sigma B factor antagonist